MCDQIGGPDHPPTDFTLREEAEKHSILALRVIFDRTHGEKRRWAGNILHTIPHRYF